jgi:ribonuclease Z
MALDGVEHRVELHYPASGEAVVRALVSLATGVLDLHLRPHGSVGEVAPGLSVQSLRHRVECYGYRLVEPDGRTMLPERLAAAGIFGPEVGQLQREGRLGRVRIEDVSVARPGQSFAFVMDTAPCPGAEALAQRADLLVAECTFADEQAELAAAYLHLTAGQAGELAGRAGARRLLLTHFSSRYPDLDPLRRQALARAGGAKVLAAADLDRIPLRRGRRTG